MLKVESSFIKIFYNPIFCINKKAKSTQNVELTHTYTCTHAHTRKNNNTNASTKRRKFVYIALAAKQNVDITSLLHFVLSHGRKEEC